MSNLPLNQLQALSDLYYTTNGDHWLWLTCTNHWNFTQSDPNPCIQKWCGVTCNIQNTTVVKLILLNYGLKGTITASIDQLIDLEVLNLGQSFLSGPIPSSLRNLTKLQTLTLSYNSLNGTLPDIFSEESSLSSIDIRKNFLTGRVPSSFQTLKYINVIYFTNNDLWGNLFNWLTTNQLSQIKILDLRYNLFSGSIPSVANLTSITGLYLKGNSFVGSVPDIFYGSSNFQDFYVSDNYLSGILPSSLLRAKSLSNLIIDDNNFQGRIDMLDWSEFSKISLISMTRNFLHGGFPLTLCNYRSLSLLNLGFNYLSGHLSIPQCQVALYPSLSIFTLQGNSFSGPLHEIFNSSLFHFLQDVALSNNEFTGSLPSRLFLNTPSLQVFGAGTNCLSGTLPVELCQLKLLLGFSIDGASTSEGCRLPIVDIPSLGMNAFITKKQMTGTIPYCMFSLHNSLSISLSGNSFTGTIPPFSGNAKELFNVSLSHNQLSGTISEEWYQVLWKVFDLSYNKLSGSFPENAKINPFSPGSKVSIEINRISGTIPSSLTTSKATLNILQGNMLTCSFDKKELPRNDPNSETYICGSNIVNNALYVWIMIICAIITSIVGWRVLWGRSAKRKSGGTELIGKNGAGSEHLQGLREGTQIPPEEERKTSIESTLRILRQAMRLLFLEDFSVVPLSPSFESWTVRFFAYTLHTRQFTVLILGYILMILLPIYATLGVYYRTYSERYAWTVAATFLSGTNATVVLIIFFTAFTVFAIGSVHMLFKKSVEAYYYRQRQAYCWRRGINWEVLAMWTTAWIVNLMIMATADSLYVYLIINRSTKYEYVIQIVLALFKLAWHDSGIFRMVDLLKRSFQGESRRNRSNQFSILLSEDDGGNGSLPLLTTSLFDSTLENMAQQRDEGKETPSVLFGSLLSRQDVRYLTYMSIVNKVIIPCLAIFFISSSCFYNALVSQSPEAAYYNVCYAVGSIKNTDDCVNILGSREDGASYTPAFSYSYQCSTAFLTDYVPVFVFMFLWSSVALPLIVLCMVKVYETYQNRHDLWYGTVLIKVALMFLPVGWGEHTESKMLETFYFRIRKLIIHRKQLLTIRVSYTIAVLFVFGSLFPPLAVIATIAVMSITSLEEYLTKRMMKQCISWRPKLFPRQTSERMGSEYEFYVEEECKDIDHSVFKVTKLIVYITCGLFGFVLFDVCGDRSGWRSGSIVMFLMIGFPFVMFRIFDFLWNRRHS